jgi:hypothetical protein
MMGSWVTAKALGKAVCSAAWLKVKGEVLVPLILICMMVRVLGPKPAGVVGAPPTAVWSGSSVK